VIFEIHHGVPRESFVPEIGSLARPANWRTRRWRRKRRNILDELASEFAGRALITKIDGDKEPELASRYGVRICPTLLLFFRGRPIESMSGFISKARLKELIESIL
jgi:hypothetical protein